MTDAHVVRLDGGRYRLSFDDEEQELLRGICKQMRELMQVGGDAVVRLFPPAYLDDPEREQEYEELMHDDLQRSHEEALSTLESIVGMDEVDETQLNGWTRALNDMRLVLGTTLDVTEDLDISTLPDDDERLPGLYLYQYLSYLQGESVDALLGD